VQVVHKLEVNEIFIEIVANSFFKNCLLYPINTQKILALAIFREVETKFGLKYFDQSLTF
jgi:hypothetical protein